MKRIVKNSVINSKQVAIKDSFGNSVTYYDLYQYAQQLDSKIEERSLIFILCDHAIETVKFIYEILFLNKVPLLIPFDVEEDFLMKLIDIYSPQYIWCKSNHILKNRYNCVEVVENHILLRTNRKLTKINSEVALLLSTSGSTGSPKLVKLSYDNLYNNAKYTCLHCGIQSDHKGITPLPLNYTYGLSFCIWHWHCGATLLITEEPVISKKFKEFYIKEQVNNIAAIPYTYKMLNKVNFWDDDTVPYLHMAMSGGAYMAEEDQRKMISILKNKFWIAYGQTECTCIISATNFEQSPFKVETVGKAFSNMEVLLDKESNELIVKSKSVCMGYAHNCKDLEKGDYNKGILRTGDIAKIDNDGYIYLKGRIKRYTKILGNRISLDEIELFLKKKFIECEFACLGKEDLLEVYYTSANEEEITEQIELKLDEGVHIPRRLVKCYEIGVIPRNQAGKIMYKELKKA